MHKLGNRLLLLLLIIAKLCVASDEILDIGTRYALAHVLTDPGASGFQCARLRSSAVGFAAKYPGRDVYIVRLAGPSGGCSSAFSTSHVTYAGLLKLREVSESVAHDCGEVIMSKSGSIVRIRNHGRVEECVEGENPLTVTIRDRSIALRWVEYWKDIEGHVCVDAFATSDDTASTEALTAFYELTRRFPSDYSRLNIGTIPWFPYNTRFAIFFPYIEGFSPPSAAEAERIVT